VFPAPPAAELAPDCARAGVLGVLPGIVGTYQALEFLKWTLGIGTPLAGKLMMIDTLAARFRTLSYQRNPECPACKDPSQVRLEGYDAVCASAPPQTREISVHELHARLAAGGDLALIDVRDPVEHDLGNLGGALIPLDELEDRTAHLPADRDRPIAVYCRSGGRSAKACRILTGLGYTDVLNVKGGVLAWQREIDPSLGV
jgi:adenylyltransferase/sulfurtransferase